MSFRVKASSFVLRLSAKRGILRDDRINIEQRPNGIKIINRGIVNKDRENNKPPEPVESGIGV